MNDKIQIRDIVEDDLPIFFEHQRDPVANLMAAFPARDEKAFMSHWKNKILGNNSSFKKTVIWNEQVTGNILCWEQDEKWLIGYWIGQEYWGKGIATAALKEFLRYLKIRPLHAYVAKNNIGSNRVLEKCGFTILKHDIEEVLYIFN